MSFKAIAKMVKYFSSKRILVLLILFFNLYQLSVNIVNIQLIQNIISVLEKTNGIFLLLIVLWLNSGTDQPDRFCLFMRWGLENVIVQRIFTLLLYASFPVFQKLSCL